MMQQNFHLGGSMKHALFLLSLVVGNSAPAVGQAAHEQTTSTSRVTSMDQTARVAPECDYDTCALRLKATVATWQIVRGSNGQEVGELGLLRPPNLAALVASVPEAAAEARAGQRRYRRTAAIVWGGSALAVAGVAFSVGSDMHIVGTTVGSVGIAGMVLGALQHPKSIDMLSKSIWLYNRALKR
jgi:hypothetical protein